MTLAEYVQMFASLLPHCCDLMVLTISIDALEYEHGCGDIKMQCQTHGMDQVYHFGLGKNYTCHEKITNYARYGAFR